MNKIKIHLPALAILAIVMLCGFYTGKKCPDLKLEKVEFSGNCQFLTGNSPDGKHLVLTNVMISKTDSVSNDIYELGGTKLASGYNCGNFINDTTMILFKSDFSAYIYTLPTHSVRSYASKINVDGMDMNDIQIVNFQGSVGIAALKNNSLVFENIEDGSVRQIFNPSQISDDSLKLVSFDIANDKIIICCCKQTGNAGIKSYYFYHIRRGKATQFYSLPNVSAHGAPEAREMDSDRYIISYYDKKSYITIAGANSTAQHTYCIGAGKVLNIHYLNGCAYVTLATDQARARLTGDNTYKLLYQGINIYKITSDIR